MLTNSAKISDISKRYILRLYFPKTDGKKNDKRAAEETSAVFQTF